MAVYHLTDSKGYVLKVDKEGAEAYKDDLTGQPLPPDLVKIARRQEMEYLIANLYGRSAP